MRPAPCSSSCATCSSSSSGTRCPASRTAPGRATGPPPTPSSPSRSRSRRWPPTTPGTPAPRATPSSARWPDTARRRCCATSSACSRWSPWRATRSDIYGAFIALPLGSLGFAILAARELDQSFADVYSTAVSVQNLRPLWDRRILAGLIAALATAGALWLNIADYENFLTLIGSVFVPMTAVLITDYFVVSRRGWDLSATAPSRWLMLLPWAAGSSPTSSSTLATCRGGPRPGPRSATPSASPRPAGCRHPSCPSPWRQCSPWRFSRWPGSAAAVFLVRDVLAPVRLWPVVRRAFGDGQVGHEVIRGGAVPVPFVGRGQDDVAGADLGDLAAAGLDAPPALEDVEGLADGVGVPRGAGRRREVDRADADSARAPRRGRWGRGRPRR